MTERSSSHPTAPCLSKEDIRDYVLGSTDDKQAAQLEQHVVECPQCEQLLVSIEDHSDAIIQTLSTLPASPDDEATYLRMRAQALTEHVEIANPARAKELFRYTSRLRDPVEAPLPFQLGNYELLQRIGRGASGAVYRALHIRLNQVVAVKVLDPACADALESFVQEMQTIGSLTHPHVVRATDAGEADGLHYLVMEYVEGVDAGLLLHHHGNLPVADACEIVRQAAIGLQFLHDKSVIHRDIKPSNLLVTATGRIKLLDLGIATRSSDHAQVAGSEELPIVKPQGTLAYMAPEQIATPDRVDTSSDLYSLGCTLFKLLVGTAPEQPVPALTDLRSDVPRSVAQMLQRLLAPEPEDRPESLSEVIELLGTVSRNSNLPLLVAPLCPEATVTQTDVMPPSHLAPRIFNRRNALAVLAAAAGASMMVWHKLPSTGPTIQKLQTARWRSLKPVSTSALLSLGAPEKTSCEILTDDRIQVVSEDLALIELGRPVVGLFALRISLQRGEQNRCGVFFNGQLNLSEETPENSVFHFQTIELKSGTKESNGNQATSRSPGRLTWNLWTASRQDKKLAAICTPLSEIAVKLNEDAPTQQLVMTFGRQGMPEITFNGDKLHESRWRFSKEGRNRQRMSPTQLTTAFLGKLGLVSSKGSQIFERPQLSYLREAHDA